MQSTTFRVALSNPSFERTRRPVTRAPQLDRWLSIRASVAFGYGLLAAIAMSLLLMFGARSIPLIDGELVSDAAALSLFVCSISLWIWMLIDHVTNGEGRYATLIAVFLALGGSLAGFVYFLGVYRHRATAERSTDGG